MPDEVKVLRTPDYLRILQEEGLLTFATIVQGHESHHQIPISIYDTKEKIEKKMALTLAQVSDEITRSGKTTVVVPADIEALATPEPTNETPTT